MLRKNNVKRNRHEEGLVPCPAPCGDADKALVEERPITGEIEENKDWNGNVEDRLNL